MRRMFDSSFPVSSLMTSLVSGLAVVGMVLLVAGSAQAMSKTNGRGGCDDCGRSKIALTFKSKLKSIFNGRASSGWTIPGRDEDKRERVSWKKFAEWKVDLPFSIPSELVDRLIPQVDEGYIKDRASTPVPEPSAALVFGAGLCVAGLGVRRRRA